MSQRVLAHRMGRGLLRVSVRYDPTDYIREKIAIQFAETMYTTSQYLYPHGPADSRSSPPRHDRGTH